MLATQGLGTGGAIVTQGYASFEIIIVVDTIGFPLYILRTYTGDHEIATQIEDNLYIVQTCSDDLLIVTQVEDTFYIRRIHDMEVKQ